MAETSSRERQRLLELVADHFLGNGVGDVSLSALARAIGSNNRMLLYYFGTKERLYSEAIETVLWRFPGLLGLVESFNGDGEIVDILDLAWLRVAAEENRAFMRVFFETFWISARKPEFPPASREQVQSWRRGIARLLQRNGFDVDDADQLGMNIVALWRGYQHELIVGTDPGLIRAAHRKAVTMLMATAPAPAGSGLG